ncbi:hypothetical protein ATPR_0247 [Acetobacter tropicalis NBRC 101654]|uniref:Uncharacterized protein n=1 Tax=Acetobacter tropicalis NBRC 101654 TaxID=749388 RepID=F7VA48_9PROT|nr:hypothetical protein ATPR_0247 [Acetobacter tropicalis NBRC 101654]
MLRAPAKCWRGVSKGASDCLDVPFDRCVQAGNGLRFQSSTLLMR